MKIPPLDVKYENLSLGGYNLTSYKKTQVEYWLLSTKRLQAFF